MNWGLFLGCALAYIKLDLVEWLWFNPSLIYFQRKIANAVWVATGQGHVNVFKFSDVILPVIAAVTTDTLWLKKKKLFYLFGSVCWKYFIVCEAD